ncbi:hypothetical protein DFH06DRAFT_1346584 [Mycena polygramma]|nr:hypothetical protein DFH06DRAFT_1346584 [Mycena polygramma]
MFSRLSAIRRLPHLSAPSKRYTSSLKEGSVAQSKGFGSVPPVFGPSLAIYGYIGSEKERAQENQYAHHVVVQIEKKKKELQQLQAQHDELHKSTKN